MRSPNLILLIVFVVMMLHNQVEAFLPSASRRYKVLLHSSESSSNKEQEIAELEAKLKQLKEEANIDEVTTIQTEEQSVSAEEEVEDIPEEAMLSEAWKEQEAADSEGGSSITTLIGVVGLVIGLALFSQVPVGQDSLSKYSSVGSAPTTQIDLGDINRARKTDLE